ncbi:CPBP family intramembrane metalloprotease [Metabacillus litoralis]|uniref:CPBP family intramembrane glutamic endopeptidase n=1 Tax=Metabacillus litoralis TaxID=152268 RepID=UPI001B9C481B|nr:CPBP family intramembrane glutamic endopeptidase [Metabacillus litoralis]MCM3163683.1 CPBP family intramembrane metalloprotease [Metabacillus litoralis]UHA60761.1 CPBP family intramembrane metalloprotease [Metabacillus litoralis]
MLITIAVLFFSGIISIAYQQTVFSAIVIIGLLMILSTNKERKFVISLLLSFLIGFVVFMVSNNFIETINIPKEIKVILNRIFLVFIIIGIILIHLFFRKTISWYNNKPDWQNPIILPFHKVNTFWFWVIGITVNGVVYLFFIIQKDIEYIQSLLLFCLTFSLINAVFEEIIWRGIMLSSLKEYTSTGFAIFITSVGFGLLHLAIGFSMPLSLLISAAGVIYALITIKTNSIYPSIIFHIIINIGMVLSGFII